MLIQLRPQLPAAERARALSLCRSLGLTVRPIDAPPSGELWELNGPASPQQKARLGDLFAVRRILDSGEAKLLAERAVGSAGDSVVQVGAAKFGAGHVSVIAGPCSVEDRERTLEIARGVRDAGAMVLRGGAYKPRTSPYSFQGLGEPGLDLLAEARLETGLAVVTEVLDPRDVEHVAEVADMLQIGSRNMSNSSLLSEVGKTNVPVLLKRGMAATADEFLSAAEYVLAEGNDQVVLCERGIRSFDKVTRNLLDLGTVCWLKQRSHLPVIVDPSHAAGNQSFVLPLGRAGIAAGADGLIVEVHPDRFEPSSDAAQAITPEQFETLVGDVQKLCAMDGRNLVQPNKVESR